MGLNSCTPLDNVYDLNRYANTVQMPNTSDRNLGGEATYYM